MFFKINNKRYLSVEQLRTSALLDAYYIIANYPFGASEILLDQYLQQQYNISLKDMCIKLLLNLTFYKDETNGLVLIFKDQQYDQIARLITYGNGAIPGSQILKTAFADY